MTDGGQRRLFEVAGLFLKLGAISFGGPAAHIALMEQETVSRRQWLSREHFLDLLAATLVTGFEAVALEVKRSLRRRFVPAPGRAA